MTTRTHPWLCASTAPSQKGGKEARVGSCNQPRPGMATQALHGEDCVHTCTLLGHTPLDNLKTTCCSSLVLRQKRKKGMGADQKGGVGFDSFLFQRICESHLGRQNPL